MPKCPINVSGTVLPDGAPRTLGPASTPHGQTLSHNGEPSSPSYGRHNHPTEPHQLRHQRSASLSNSCFSLIGSRVG
eukprot:4104124-Amphidinium_carterae.1